MKINTVTEMEDKTLSFTGELTASESALVVSFGLNGMLAMGLMALVPGVQFNETFSTESPMQ